MKAERGLLRLLTVPEKDNVIESIPFTGQRCDKAELSTIPKMAFEKYFQQWKERWTKCVKAQGADRACFEFHFDPNPAK
ncbi:hypothetical protein TNCV_1956581 [Trichonephila clavipes]|nr:hypothetical protein TNCV_1956581 [Trichonephila clavipes]